MTCKFKTTVSITTNLISAQVNENMVYMCFTTS